jgi:hypothetical protein
MLSSAVAYTALPYLWRTLKESMRMPRQPCASCGDETAAGSPLYPDRKEYARQGGSTMYVCGDCRLRIVGHDRGELTEAQLARLRSGRTATDR